VSRVCSSNHSRKSIDSVSPRCSKFEKTRLSINCNGGTGYGPKSPGVDRNSVARSGPAIEEESFRRGNNLFAGVVKRQPNAIQQIINRQMVVDHVLHYRHLPALMGIVWTIKFFESLRVPLIFGDLMATSCTGFRSPNSWSGGWVVRKEWIWMSNRPHLNSICVRRDPSGTSNSAAQAARLQICLGERFS